MSGAVVRKVEKGEKGTSLIHFLFFGLLSAKLVTICCLTSCSQTIVGYLQREVQVFHLFLCFLVLLPLLLFFYLFIYLFIYFWLCWVFVSARVLSLVVASGGRSSSRCAGLSLSRPLLLRSTGSSRAGSVVVAHGPSCSAACGIFPDQGSNPCALHQQADSQPLRHQGSPRPCFF